MQRKNNQKSPAQIRAKYAYRQVSENLVDDASVGLSTVPWTITTDGGGFSSGYQTLAPQGIDATYLSSGAFAYTVHTYTHLAWLRSMSANFEEYRVTNAVLLVVGNVGSTTSGRMAVMSSPDPADSGNTTFSLLAVGGTTFDLATLAGREKRVPLKIDSGWKKISKRTNEITGGSSDTITPINTVSDLAFTSIRVAVSGAPASTLVCTFNLVYDVEFRHPISSTVNV